MPKSTFVPKYSFHKPSGQAFVRIRGKFFYLGRFDSPESHEAYGRFIGELSANPSSPPVTTASSSIREKLTIFEVCAAYLDYIPHYYQKNGIPTRQVDNIKLAIRYLVTLYGSTFAEDFGPRALKALRQMMIEKEWSRGYINAQVKMVKKMFKWACSEEMLPASVHQALTTVEGLSAGRSNAKEAPPIQPVPYEVVDTTLPHLPRVVADMVRLQRLTGARPGEVFQMRPMDVNCSNEVWEYRPASHKTEHHGKSRVVFIGPQAQAILQPYLERPAEAYCFSPAESEEKRHVEQRAKRQTKVQPSQLNRKKSYPLRQTKACYNKDSYRCAIVRAVEKVNKQIRKDAAEKGNANPTLIPAWHPNQLRHTAATNIRKQYGLEAAQIILGHSTADVTQIYAERDAAKAIEVIRKMG